MGIKNYIQPVLALRVAEAGVSTSPITINDNVWIGANATIAAGVTIGKHFVIGTGSVVTKDVPAGELWVGNPARCIKRLLNKK